MQGRRPMWGQMAQWVSDRPSRKLKYPTQGRQCPTRVEWPNAGLIEPTWAWISCHLHLLACKSELEVDLWWFDSIRTKPEVVNTMFRHWPRHHHLPHMQQWAKNGFIRCFNTVRTTTTSLACNSKLEVLFIWCRNAIRATTTSLAVHGTKKDNVGIIYWMGSYIKLVSCMFSTIIFYFMSSESGVGFWTRRTHNNLRTPRNPYPDLPKPLPLVVGMGLHGYGYG